MMMKQWTNVARRGLLVLAAALVLGSAGCARGGGDNPNVETGGMPPDVAEEFNRRMQNAQQGGAPTPTPSPTGAPQ
jgi:hypothetical protein